MRPGVRVVVRAVPCPDKSGEGLAGPLRLEEHKMNRTCIARPLIPLALLLLAASPFARAADDEPRFEHVSPSGVVFTVTADGLSRVAHGGRVLAQGGWYAWNAGPGWFASGEAGLLDLPPHACRQAGATVREKTLQATGDGAVRVRHVIADAVATFDYAFAGEDVTIRTRLENNHPTLTLSLPAFGGLRFSFSREPEGILPVWHASYLRATGLGAFHPSHLNKIGGSYATDGVIGVGVSPLYRGLHRSLVFWDWDAWNPDTPERRANRWLSYLRPEPIPPGGALTFELVLRVSPDTDWRHLLTPYKTLFRQNHGEQRYVTDFRSVAVAHLNRNRESIGPDNPYGFHGGFRRLDQPEQVAALCDLMIPGLKAANGHGLILWGQGGQEPRGQMYRADFDILPPEVATNWPALAARFREAGLRLGVTTRPRHLHLRQDWERDLTVDINADDPRHLDVLWQRFKNMIDRGCTLFYLDSFGSSFDDVTVMRFLREKMGPEIQTYAEHACDVMAVYSAFYSETDFWAKGHKAWVTEDQWVPRIGLDFLKVVNWLTGPVPVISRAYDIHGALPKDFESSPAFFYRHGLSPMIHDSGLNADAAAWYRKLQEPYVNEDGSLK